MLAEGLTPRWGCCGSYRLGYALRADSDSFAACQRGHPSNIVFDNPIGVLGEDTGQLLVLTPELTKPTRLRLPNLDAVVEVDGGGDDPFEARRSSLPTYLAVLTLASTLLWLWVR